MKALWFGFALLCACARLPVLGQEASSAGVAQDAAQAQDQSRDQTPAPSPTPAPERANRSALGVTPGTEALQPKDLYEKGTGYLHPFRRMSRFVLKDEERIWTSPFHTKKRDIKYWLIFGGATGTLIAFDARIQKNAPNPPWLVTLGTRGSYLGAAYTLIPISAGFYFLGSKTKNEHFRETGLLSFEALADAEILSEILKVVADRQRPLEDSGEGHFFQSNNRMNAGFPSGHSINTFALASVFAHEYHRYFWVKFLAYAYATTVALSRLAANQHFPGDTMAGGAMGWFIGDYVYGKRHDPDVDKQAAIEKIMAHVHLGGPMSSAGQPLSPPR
jgi:membrane-associated phospholipid phosphatase